MRGTSRVLVLGFIACACALGIASLAMSTDAVAKGKPAACCNPLLEPGTNGNPFCFEGHSCCSDGRWRCRQPNGQPSCPAGTSVDGPWKMALKISFHVARVWARKSI